MTRWEHLVRGLPNGPPEAIEAWLNAHGTSGWGLVTVDWTSRTAVFQRPRWRQTPISAEHPETPVVTAAD